MRWYSRSREDYIDLLTKRYYMKELVLVTTPDCVKCRFIKPKLEEWCNENWYKFKELKYSEWLTEITSIPSAMIWEDVILDYDGILELITKKKSFF